jgi:hypothetical protein
LSASRKKPKEENGAGRPNEVLADMLTVSSPLSSQLSWQRERLRQRRCFLHACIGARPRYPAIKAISKVAASRSHCCSPKCHSCCQIPIFTCPLSWQQKRAPRVCFVAESVHRDSGMMLCIYHISDST